MVKGRGQGRKAEANDLVVKEFGDELLPVAERGLDSQDLVGLRYVLRTGSWGVTNCYEKKMPLPLVSVSGCQRRALFSCSAELTGA